VPENVTSLACREYARAERIRWAEMAESAESLIEVLDDDPMFAAQAKVTPEQLAAQDCEHRALAGRYEAAR
jgi:hypothetical protein